MKISKVTCLAIASLLAATSANADLSSTRSSYQSSATSLEKLSSDKSAAFFKAIDDFISTVNTIVNETEDNFTNFATEKASNKGFQNIAEYLTTIADTDWDSLGLSGDDFTIGTSGSNNVSYKVEKDTSNSNKAKISIKVKTGSETELKADGTGLTQITSTDKALYNEALLNSLNEKNQEFKTQAEGTLRANEESYIKELTKSTNKANIEAVDAAFIAKTDLNAFLDNSVKIIADAVKEAIDAINAAYTAATSEASDKTAKIADANNKLAALTLIESDLKLAESGAFNNINGKSSTELSETNLVVTNKEDLDTALAALQSKVDNNTLTSLAALKTTKEELPVLLADKKVSEVLNTKLTEVTGTLKAKETAKTKKDTAAKSAIEAEDKKIPKLSSTEKTTTKLTELKTAINTVKGMSKSNETEKKAYIVAAAKAGFTATKDNSTTVNEANAESLYGASGTGSDVDAIFELFKTAVEAASTAIDTVITAVTAQESADQEYLSAKKDVQTYASLLQKAVAKASESAVTTLADSIKDTPNVKNLLQKGAVSNLDVFKNDIIINGAGTTTVDLLKSILKDANSQEIEVLNALLDSLSKDDEFLKNNLANLEATKINEAYKSVTKSSNDTLNSLNSLSPLNAISIANVSATTTRLAKLANPFNSELALASAINKLENEKFADGGASLDSVVRAYTNRFEKDNNVWANVSGVKTVSKDAPNTELYGFSVGYDRVFDNLIVGGYVSYANANSKGNNLTVKSDVYEVGAYARAYFDKNEIDARLGYGFGKNNLERITSGVLVTNQEAKYDSNLLSLSLDYGYIFDISDATFIKPILGIAYYQSKTDAINEKGNLKQSISKITAKKFDVKLGAELRQYVKDGGYVYVTPAIVSEVYKNTDDAVISYNGGQGVLFKNQDKKRTYFTLNAGADMALTEALSINVNLGTKLHKDERQISGTVGAKYKF